MKKTNALFKLIDMDVGTFVSYELTAESLNTKLFRIITLNKIPLKSVKTLRAAGDEDITPLNHLNWFSAFKRKSLCPVYTLQATETSPLIFMRLAHGSHFALQNALGQLHG